MGVRVPPTGLRTDTRMQKLGSGSEAPGDLLAQACKAQKRQHNLQQHQKGVPTPATAAWGAVSGAECLGLCVCSP